MFAVAVISASTAMTALAAPMLAQPALAKTSSTTLRVATYNINTVSADKMAKGNHRKWKDRRAAVASQILGRSLDVVGIQEANQSSIYRKSLRYGVNQYMDLRGELNARGGHYEVTNRYAYNCKRSASTQRCHYKYRGASQDNRILYNTKTLSVVSQGSKKFHHQARGKNPRFIAWAVFASKVNGRQFLFTDTHLDPYKKSVRKAQWNELISFIDGKKDGRRVVAVGDFNTSKFTTYAHSFIPKMKRHGYGDTVNQTYHQPFVSSRRASSTYHGWVNSFNGWRRNIKPYAYEDAKGKIGNGIDWIFATNSMRVTMWEVVADIDSHNQLRGTIPSDHNMVRANLVL